MSETAILDSEESNKKSLILIADDQPVIQKAMSLILDKLAYPSITADDGEAALEMAVLYDVALVLMDIQMPKMDGYEATKNLRKWGFKKPIIAITASDFADERESCLKAGINDVLIKPCKRIDLENMLLKWLDVRHPDFFKSAVEESDIAIAFDSARMLENFSNELEVALPLLSRFIERTKTQLEDIPILEKAEGWEETRRLAHMIKGAALTMGGEELGKTAARLEKAYKNIDKAEIKAALPLVQEAFDLYKKEAENFVRSKS